MDAFAQFDELAATAGHLALVHRKLETLARAKRDAWSQLLTAAARMYASGDVVDSDLSDMYRDIKANYGPGFTDVWDSHMPVQASKVRYMGYLHRPNGPGGSWLGDVPLRGDGPRPRVGQAVVYVLFDDANDPVYVGSTEDFRARLSVHQKEKPGIRRWTAFACDNREHAYQVEDRLLKEHKPRMNKRAAR